jgi:hypothetical protein
MCKLDAKEDISSKICSHLSLTVLLMKSLNLLIELGRHVVLNRERETLRVVQKISVCGKRLFFLPCNVYFWLRA